MPGGAISGIRGALDCLSRDGALWRRESPVGMRSVQGFAALRVEGSILPAEFLEEVAALEAPRQSGADYGLSKSLSLRDEIGRYWRIASDRHERYARRKRRGDLARNRVCVDEWLVPFVSEVLGYRPLTPTLRTGPPPPPPSR